MTYKEKKKQLLKMKDDLLIKYNKILVDVMNLADEYNNILFSGDFSKNEIADWTFLVENDEELRKIVRLVAALSYVEFPNDEAVLDSLDANIDDNLNYNNEYIKKLQ